MHLGDGGAGQLQGRKKRDIKHGEKGGRGDCDGGKTKAEAEGAGAGAGEGLERVSATTFSGPGMWTTELVNSAR